MRVAETSAMFRRNASETCRIVPESTVGLMGTGRRVGRSSLDRSTRRKVGYHSVT